MDRSLLRNNRLLFSFVIIYIFVIFYSNLVPNKQNVVFHIVSLAVSVFHFAILVNVKKHLESKYVVITDWSWLVLTILVCLFFLISVLGKTRTIFYDNFYYTVPVLFVHCIYYLTNGRKIDLDPMMDLRHKMANFTDKGLLYRMKSMSKLQDGSFDNIAVENVGKIVKFNDKSFEDSSLNEYDFADVRFLFVNTRFSNSVTLSPPSPSLYSKFSGLPIIENPYGLETLRLNCLTGVYISFLDYSLRQDKLKQQNWIGNNQFLLSNNYKINRDLDGVNGKLEITLIHNWNLMEIKKISSTIVDALKTQKSIQQKRLTEEMNLLIYKNNLREGIDLDLFLASLIINSKIGIDKYDNYEYYWRGLVDCFDKSSVTLKLNNVSNVENKGHVDSIYLKNRVVEIESGVLEIVDNSTEEFIRYHDYIGKNEVNLDHFRETQLTEIVKQMMSEFDRTQYLEKLTLDGKYDISDLVKTRRGILTASAIILKLIYENYQEVKK